MTTYEATMPAAAAMPAAAPGYGHARFVGRPGEFWWLVVRGTFFLMITLGIYRFWLATDIRRFLWSNTELAGESFEYTGTGRELLLGFLFAIAALVPLYVLLFLAALAPGLGLLANLSGVVSAFLLAVLGQYAIYRARRYRLTRTVYRGVRFNQTGSAWRYAVCSLFWWVLITLTVGLAYPFAQSRLERFKMRHTHFGNLAGRFEGTGFGLLVRGFLLWLLVIGPFIASIVFAVTQIDWPALGRLIEEAVASDNPEQVIRQFANANTGLALAVVIAGGALTWSMLAAILLYPAFQAVMLRWWTAGLRFGDIAVSSQLRTGSIYGAYLRYIGVTILLSGAIGVVALLLV